MSGKNSSQSENHASKHDMLDSIKQLKGGNFEGRVNNKLEELEEKNEELKELVIKSNLKLDILLNLWNSKYDDNMEDNSVDATITYESLNRSEFEKLNDIVETPSTSYSSMKLRSSTCAQAKGRK